jgi:hypothetical protein
MALNKEKLISFYDYYKARMDYKQRAFDKRPFNDYN